MVGNLFAIVWFLGCLSSATFWMGIDDTILLSDVQLLPSTDYNAFKDLCSVSPLENEGKVAFLNSSRALFFCDGAVPVPLTKGQSEGFGPTQPSLSSSVLKAVGGGAVLSSYQHLHLLPQPLEVGLACAEERELCLAYSSFERTILRCEETVWRRAVVRGDAPAPHIPPRKGPWPGVNMQHTPATLTAPYLCFSPLYERTDTEITSSYDCTPEVAGAMHCGRSLSADSAVYCEWCDGEAWGPLGLSYVYRDPNVCNGTDGWMVPVEDLVFGEFSGSCHCKNNSESIYEHCEGNIPHCSAYDSTSGNCSRCSSGYVNVDHSLCSACPLPTFPNAEGECVTCPDGQFARTTVDPPFIGPCTICPEGSACSEGIKVQCAAGHYSLPGSSDCEECPRGTYSPSPCSSSCTSCSSGTFSPTAGRSTCDLCMDGRISAPGSFVCKRCPAGTFSQGLSSTCTECSAGQYSEHSGSAECQACESGTMSLSGASNCTVCPDGFYSDFAASSCYACLEPMSYCVNGQLSYCVATQVSNSDHTACVDCPLGQEGNLGKCTTCPTGMYKNQLHGPCLSCPTGATTVNSPSPSDHDNINDCFCVSEGFIPLSTGCTNGMWAFVTIREFAGDFLLSSGLCEEEIDMVQPNWLLSRNLTWAPLISYKGFGFDSHVDSSSHKDLYNLRNELIMKYAVLEGTESEHEMCWGKEAFALPTDVAGNAPKSTMYWTGWYCRCNRGAVLPFDTNSNGQMGTAGSLVRGTDCVSAENSTCDYLRAVICAVTGDLRRG